MLKPSISETIIECYKSGAVIMLQEEEHDKTGTSTTEDNEAVIKIKEILDTKVRPAVAKDGGDIIFQSFNSFSTFCFFHAIILHQIFWKVISRR